MSMGYGYREREERISPREGEMIKYRDMRTPLIFQLLDGNIIEGAVRWYDHMSVRVVRNDHSELTLFYHAICYYQTKSQD